MSGVVEGSSQPVPAVLGEHQFPELARTFAPPVWLRDLGRASWILVAMAALLVGVVWFLGATATIVGPVVAATIVATVSMPVVAWLEHHRVPRLGGAAIVLVALVALGVLVFLAVLGGIKSQSAEISQNASAAVDELESWATSLGVDQSSASSAGSTASSSASAAISTLVNGVISGIKGVSSLLFGLSLAAISLFLLLKDGPSMRGWIDRHLGVPEPVAATVTGDVIRSLRGYFHGVTIIATFNALVVGLAALDPRRAPRRDDRPGDLHLRVRPVHRGVCRWEFAVLVALGVGRSDDGGDHAGGRPARQRAAPERSPTVRDGFLAGPEPAPGHDRDDRCRLHSRDARARPRCASHVGRGSHLA